MGIHRNGWDLFHWNFKGFVPKRCKIHFCLIISSISTYNYNLSKFLTNLLVPVILTTNSTKDLFTFCEEIKKVTATTKFLISYVCRLFTSILLRETIDIAVDLLFEHNPDFKITKNELKKLFDFATSGTRFLFDGSFYDQIDDVAMGSPLGLVLANLFMGYHEVNWLQVFKDWNNFILLLCRWYFLLI